MNTESPFSEVNKVLIIAYGSLVFLLLSIFVIRQFRRKLHLPMGDNAPKKFKEVIDSQLAKVNNIRYQPRLLAQNDERLKHRGQNGCYNYLYRMQALDAVKDSGIMSPDLAWSPSTLTSPCYKKWLQALRNSNSLIKTRHSRLIDRLLEGYIAARHGTMMFGEVEFLRYKEDLAELAAILKVHSSSTSLNQQQELVVLTSSPGPSSECIIQMTYLPSSGQCGKRPKHFLELKNSRTNIIH